MPVPKFRTSKSKRNLRRSHDGLKASPTSVCPNCNDIKFPHSVCESCGHYRGKQMLEPKAKMGASDSFTPD